MLHTPFAQSAGLLTRKGLVIGMTKVRWDDLSSRVGRNDLVVTLASNWWRIDRRDRAMAVHEAWYMAEFPERLADQKFWLEVFNKAGFAIDGQPAPRPAEETITLYRGGLESRRNGLSWTTDRIEAMWFAERFLPMSTSVQTFVWSITVPVSYCLAMINLRGESEVVVDTTKLTDEDYKIEGTFMYPFDVEGNPNE